MGFQQGFRINTNTASLDTYRAYSKSQAGLEQNIERLSSGLRINSAKDDAAGLAISERMNNQVRGMQQANRNVQQGVNLLQTAEGAMNEISNILGRMRELAVQSASDGVNGDDRASIDLEFQQLKAEITRIGDSTEYNSMKLIDGSRAKSIQMAPNGTDASPVNTAVGEANKVVTDSVKVASFAASGTYAVVTSSGDETKLELYLEDEGDTTYSKVDEFVKAEGNIEGGNEIHFDDAGIVFKLEDDYAMGQFDATESGGVLTDASAFADGIKELVVDDSVFTTVQVGSNNDADHASTLASVGANVTENRITFNIADTTSAGLGISTIDLDSLGDAQSAINYLDSAIAKINDERSNVGSLQNRLEFTSSNLMNSVQNNSASMSTIRDADFAAEAAELAKNQILTQSGTAMLAQANSLSQNVLSLIR